MNAIILLVVGLLAVFLEFFLPGGIMGVVGGLLIASSIVVFAIQTNSGIEVFLFVLFMVVGVAAMIKLALWRIKKGKEQNTLYLEKDQEGYQASSFNDQIIGKQGTAFSDLKPSGFILIEGKQYQALAQIGYIEKGSPVKVLSGQGAYYVVKLCKIENEKKELI